MDPHPPAPSPLGEGEPVLKLFVPNKLNDDVKVPVVTGTLPRERDLGRGLDHLEATSPFTYLT
jgi:hypothetical protein